MEQTVRSDMCCLRKGPQLCGRRAPAPVVFGQVHDQYTGVIRMGNISRTHRPIELEHPEVRAGRIEVQIKPGAARKYFAADRFWVDYGDIDLTMVPPHIALLPALGTVLPVAIAVGVSVTIPALDPIFSAQARRIDEHLRSLYRHFSQTPLLLSGPPAEDTWKPAKPGGACLLYSGGIDSTTSLIRHREQVGALISVWGADVEVENADLWAASQSITATAPAKPGTRRITARTNMRAILDQLRLDRTFDRGFSNTNWWGGAHHGLGLTTLVAPVARALDLGRVIIASSHWEEFYEPWGSSPTLDNQVKWTGGAVLHDGHELNRQDKIAQFVAPFIKDGHALKLSVCYHVNRGGENVNCGNCEKCLRTASGLLAADVDPKLAGVPVGEPQFDEWRRKMDAGQIDLGTDRFYWTDVQNTIPASSHNNYLRWLKQHDMQQHVAAGEPKADFGDMPAWQYFGIRLARHLPYRLRRELRAPVAKVLGGSH